MSSRFAGLAVLCMLSWACQDLQEPQFGQASRQLSVEEQGSRFIVTLREGAAPAAVAREHGVAPDFIYQHVLTGFAGSIGEAARAGLLRDARVQRVERDVPVSIDGEPVTQAGATWGIDRIDQRPLPLSGTYTYAFSGAGVTAYIVDTGLRYTHGEFGGRAAFGFDAFGGDGSDCHGHGTHVAGTVGGATYGVAKGVRLVAVRVLDCRGSGTTAGVIAGLDWIAANGARPGVANLSLGGGASTSLDDAIARLFDAGVVSAVAAGNSNADACSYSPARAPSAMTVGASDASDRRASFSNFGDCVDWFAPGVSITSAGLGSDGATAIMSGTSMASPHAAGAAALFLAANPGATPQQVRDGLYAQASKGIVTSASSANNHLLFSLAEEDASMPPPAGNLAPTAAFQVSCSYLACSFTDQSTDSDGVVAAWSWSFGDATSAAVRHPTHSFAAAGTYLVTLTATDDDGAVSTASRSVTVASPPKISLVAVGTKTKGQVRVDLAWSGAATSQVDIFRNGVKLATAPNSGAYADTSAKGSLSSYAYQVCELNTVVCSAVVRP